MNRSRRATLMIWHKLLLLVGGSMIILALGLTLVTWWSLGQASQQIGQNGHEILSTQAQIFLLNLAEGQVDAVDLQLAQAQAAATYSANVVGESLTHGEFDQSKSAQFWSSLLERVSNSTNFYYVNSEGQLWVYPELSQELDLPVDFDLTQEPFFPLATRFGATNEEIVWSEVHANPFSLQHDLVIDAIAPVVVESELRGYVGVSISLNQLMVHFNQRQPIRGSYTFLLSGDQQFIAGPPNARADLLPSDMIATRDVVDLSHTDDPDLDRVLENMGLGQTAVDQVNLRQELKFLAYKPLQNVDWRLGIVVPVPLATAAAKQLVEVVQVNSQQALVALLFGTAGLLLITLIASGFITQRLISPLRDLVVTTERIAQGDLESRVKITSRDEIGQLSTAFNTMTDQLQHFIGSLEDQIRARVDDLYLSIEVGQRAVSVRDLDELLSTIAEFIRSRFNLYYTHIYFVDDLGQSLIIKSGTGLVGQELLARHHSLPIGSGSIVGQVAASGQPIVVSDTEESEIHKPNPLLPDTRSELAVPLIVEGRVIGVLDMQSDRANTFTEKNLTVFEAMAVQLAVSIDSAQQWAASQNAQQRAEEALKQLTRENWSENLVTRREIPAYTYDLSIVTPLEPQAGNGGVSVPVTVQNQSIGELSVKTSNDRSLSEDEQALMNAVAQQLAQKAENLRLFEQTQQWATREQIARQITDKIRASGDIEAALKTAAVELSKALGVTRAVVDLQVRRPSDEVDQK